MCNDIGEGESTIQCWICPDCYDDHNQDDDKKCIANLKADKEKLQEENKLLQKNFDEYSNMIHHQSVRELMLNGKIDKLQEEKSKLIKTLEFYAIKCNWMKNSKGQYNQITERDLEKHNEYFVIGGKLARQTVNKLEGSE